MKEIKLQVTDFEHEYIQEYAKQFDISPDLNFLRSHSPNVQNDYSHLKMLFFFPSNYSEKKLLQIQEKYTQFEKNRIFFLLKVGENNIPSAFNFIEAELISYQDRNLVVDINISIPHNFEYDLYETHTNKKPGHLLTRKQLICYQSAGNFQALFQINLQHICDVILRY